MKFGRVEQPENIDFTIPKDHPDTPVVLSKTKKDSPLSIYVGCAKWNRQDLKNFYPRGTKVQLVNGKIVTIVGKANNYDILCWASTLGNPETRKRKRA